MHVRTSSISLVSYEFSFISIMIRIFSTVIIIIIMHSIRETPIVIFLIIIRVLLMIMIMTLLICNEENDNNNNSNNNDDDDGNENGWSYIQFHIWWTLNKWFLFTWPHLPLYASLPILYFTMVDLLVTTCLCLGFLWLSETLCGKWFSCIESLKKALYVSKTLASFSRLTNQKWLRILKDKSFIKWN